MSESDFESEMTTRWLQSGIGPREAAAKLQRACRNVGQLSEEAMEKLEAEWRHEPDATHIVYSTLGGPWNRLTGFDCEDVESPADHTDIVFQLAGITDDQFALDDVVQTTEPNGDLKLTLARQGKQYSFAMENHGSWCNLAGTLDGLNHILNHLAIKERFIALYTGGQTGVVAFVLPDEFLSVARELHIRLESASDAE